MRYTSTRGGAAPASFVDAVLAGLAPDGGLYVPDSWPALSFGPSIANGHYAHAAMGVLEAFSGDEIGSDDGRLARLCNDAYLAAPSEAEIKAHTATAKWPTAVTPLRQLGVGNWLLELFHGPSLSFKDVAMQLIGPLYDFALLKRDQRLSVLCATSGDTGGAAVEALKNRERVDLFVLTPRGRVSDVQRRFMTSSGAPNVHAIEIDGDFDACQAIVKALFADGDFAARASLSGVNSINWARIVAQSVYFHIAAQTLGAAGPVDFVVPTGNMGDAYSGWVAKQMGAPIGRIVVATNANDILSRALASGRFERGASKATLSPAMDIQVASNFERILYNALGCDADRLRALYGQFAQSGSFDIPQYALETLRADFSAGAVDDARTKEVMAQYAKREALIICPHTAVGLGVRHHPVDGPTVHLATAHPAKFPETVKAVTGIHPPLPAKCADLYERREVFASLPADLEAVKTHIRERSRAWA